MITLLKLRHLDESHRYIGCFVINLTDYKFIFMYNFYHDERQKYPLGDKRQHLKRKFILSLNKILSIEVWKVKTKRSVKFLVHRNKTHLKFKDIGFTFNLSSRHLFSEHECIEGIFESLVSFEDTFICVSLFA